MFQQTFAIIRNTFFESVRQPIMLVVLGVATFLLIMANPLSAFTMADDQRMFIDMGLATIFLCGTLLAAFIATNVLGREIENRTVLTVVSKPVSRPIFVLGKYLGVAAALVLGTIYMIFVFMLAERHTVLQTVRDPLHLPVLTFGTIAAAIALAVGVWCNYFYNRVFGSTVICVITPLAGLAYLFSLMFRPDFSTQPIATSFKPQLWLAVAGLVIAILVLTAIALAASTRFGQVMTLVITIGVFMLGMLSDWFIGRPLERMRETWTQEASAAGLTETVDDPLTVRMVTGEVETIDRRVEQATVPLTQFASGQERVTYRLLQAAYAVVPNFQVLLLSDSVTQGHKIPPAYVGRAATYGGFYIVAALSLAVLLFQRREVG